MGKIAQLVMGPAGTGKSTYCDAMRQYCENTKRPVHVVNLDPAADAFKYTPSIDIRDLITVDDVMEEESYGPNGGLVYCMDHMEWLEEQIGDYAEDYLIIDCPGQIELYTHFPHMKRIAEALRCWDYNVCAVWLIDSHFIEDSAKFLSACLTSLSAMIQMELPCINVMTKMDLLGKRGKSEKMERFFDADTLYLVSELNKDMGPRFRKLNEAIGTLLDEYSLVSFVPLDITDAESVGVVLAHIDNATQFGEDAEPREPREKEDDDDDLAYGDAPDD